MQDFVRMLQALFGAICLILGFVTLEALRHVYQNHTILIIAGSAFLITGVLFVWLAIKGNV